MSEQAKVTSATIKALLPFKVEQTPLGGRQYLTLLYDTEVLLPGGQGVRRLPQRLDVGFEDAPANPLGLCVYRLMQLFWDLETRESRHERERDELQAAQQSLQKEVNTLRGQVEELKRRTVAKRA